MIEGQFRHGSSLLETDDGAPRRHYRKLNAACFSKQIKYRLNRSYLSCLFAHSAESLRHSHFKSKAMFDGIRRASRRSKEKKDLLLTAETFKKWAGPVTEKWPEIRQKIEPVLQKTGEKLGDLYVAGAQIVAEQKERLDDRLAERRARSTESAKGEPGRGSFR